jgi:tetratricopeptide (TPR) repeat protein
VIEQLLRAENALALGLLDQAEQIYEQTLAHDPANAIALVGLSRVALERGDERASLGFARRALSIDPENGQAGRMIDRLEEVIHERGDVIPQEAPSATTPMPAPATPPATTPTQPAATPPAATPPPDVPPSPSAAAPEVAPKRRGLLRRLTGRS